ncbi:pyridoxamine 5'-phosphate oxidase family protein [Umezawaea endophytica]|uniref:Pyridoxamine 5'-phosphate oxidase family protein n=1 Tax=Umezawaea endophytica TaxID=1654476 RepID=A0A9X2VW42_9PSEU|nr:pyridoxamine 5'-phosphate oxidase family protein [Umezawaea endophytica]MCS7483701.1 pyridoxamine 5'-phosphate oxidase family protein [Umezawaea endophytica]
MPATDLDHDHEPDPRRRSVADADCAVRPSTMNSALHEEPSGLLELSEAESLRLMSGVPFGRVVFSRDALPAIRPVNHVVDKGSIIIRTHLGAAVLSSVGMVVAYEADSIDPVTRTGWSVIVIGVAKRVIDVDEAARFERELKPWVRRTMDHTIRIVPEMVTGFELTAVPEFPAP